MLLANVRHAIPHFDDFDSERCARFNDTGLGIEEYEEIECTCHYQERLAEVLTLIEELEEIELKAR